MITEDYCSYEVSKLLKEKGFNEPCYRWYDNKGDVCAKLIVPDVPPNYSLREYYLCPSQSIVMKWLREEYGIFIEISALKRYRCVYTIYKLFEEKITEVWNDGTYVSYEDAVEAAIKYCLENLI